MILALILLIVGLVLLTYSADRLIYGVSCLARFIKISPFLISLVIIGIGISLPELFVAIAAALSNKMDIAVGTAVGSNIINILLIIGCMALLHPLTINSGLLYQELPVMLVITVICGFIFYNDYLSRLDGVILLTLFFISFFLILKLMLQSDTNRPDPFAKEQLAELPKPTSQTVAFLWIIIGLIILPLAAKIVVDNASVLARSWGASELVISLTILSIGTSLPEISTAIAGALKKEHTLALGSIVGSNIVNLSLVLGLPALLAPGSYSYQVFYRDYWVMLFATVCLVLFCLMKKHTLGRRVGGFLLLTLIAYFGLLLYDTITPSIYS